MATCYVAAKETSFKNRMNKRCERAGSRRRSVVLYGLPCKIEQDLVRMYDANAAMNVDYDRMIAYIPMFNPEKIRKTFHYIQDYLCNNCTEDVVYIPTCSELSIAFAYAANTFARSGRPAVARQLYYKARELVYHIIEDIESNVDIACACTFIAMFLVNSGEVQQAQYYQENARYCLPGFLSSTDPQVQEQARYISVGLDRIEYLLDENYDIYDLYQSILSYYSTYLHSDYKQESVNTLEEQLEKIDRVVNKIVGEYNCDDIPSDDVLIMRRFCLVSAHGVKLKILRDHNIIDQRNLETANEITKLTKEEGFDESAAFACLGVSEALLVHANCLMKCRNAELVSNLTADIRAMNALADRNAIVRNRYSGLLHAVSGLL